jgi:hypothetical protein
MANGVCYGDLLNEKQKLHYLTLVITNFELKFIKQQMSRVAHTLVNSFLIIKNRKKKN